jgi:cytochrome P450
VQELHGEDPTYESVGQLSYLESALLETLRLHPSVASDSKDALKDDTLPDGTFVPAGVTIAYNPYSFGRSSRIWGKDVLQFKVWMDELDTGLKGP